MGEDRETLDLDDVIILQDDGEEITRVNEYKITEIPYPLHSKELVTNQAELVPKRLSDFGTFLLLDRK